ncbi:hypothetical protein JCM1393_00190 [Clostridium carnis]
MKNKKGTIIFGIIIGCLIIAILVVGRAIISKDSKEIVAATKFIEELQENNVIDIGENYIKDSKESNTEIIPLNKSTNTNSKIQFSVIVQNYGVDLDSDYNVIGFSKKESSCEVKEIKYTEEEAKKQAEKYLKEIANEKIMFKEIRIVEGSNEPFYTVVFYKCKNGYPYYEYEIIAKINKCTGKLDGYTNYTLDHVKHISKIKIDKNDANKIAKEYLGKLKIEGKIDENPFTAYVSDKDKHIQLAYVYTIESKNKEGKSIKYKLYVSANSGEVLWSDLEALVSN